MDSVAIGAWDDGRPSAFCSGYGHVVAADGRVVLALGAEVVPHGQELRLGPFVGPPHLQQMAIRYHGHQPDIPVAAADGRVLRRLRINDSNNNTGWYHCIPADVCGDEREEVILYDPWSPEIYLYTPYPLATDAFLGYRPTPRQYDVRLLDRATVRRNAPQVLLRGSPAMVSQMAIIAAEEGRRCVGEAACGRLTGGAA